MSQSIFAFEWTDPEEWFLGQIGWTRLPQGYKNSPTLFVKALNADLKEFRMAHPEPSLLQYVNDLLFTSKEEETCKKATEDLLEELQFWDYRLSAKKAQLCCQAVTYLRYHLREGKRALSQGCTEAILRIPPTKTKTEVREFLGAVGWFLSMDSKVCQNSQAPFRAHWRVPTSNLD